MVQATIGIIGGSGLYQMDALKDVQEVQLNTPFGAPSDALIVGTLEETTVAFLARHGRNHHLMPTELPFRANIHAMKQLGVKYLISASAVGSLQEAAKPLDMVIPDQFIDRTRNRISTFFGEGIVAHIGFADPVCHQLAGVLADAVASLPLTDVTLHRGGTYVCMEGPAFSTQAESHLYRSWGATVIGMTNLPEAKLAREAEIAYATLALVTDYDCWHEEEEHVTVEMVIEYLNKNVGNARKLLVEIIGALDAQEATCSCHESLKFALITQGDIIPPDTYEKLKPVIGKYIKKD